MCGIIGINHLKKADIDHSLLYKATSFLRHRGPDDEGYLLVNKNHKRYRLLSGPDSSRGIKRQFPGITAIRPQEGYDLAFGFRRLSILDLSDRGHQPMGYKNNWIVYNGEVFNYQEIRDELKEKGYSFKTRTDTEVVLAAYHRWGRDCVLRFNGQWAFCIYDSHNDLLFCSRDRFGIIPFYFYKDDNTFAFASEIKSLLSFPFVKRSVNEDMIFDFLVFGLLDHTQHTCFKNIEQIKPSHNLIFDLKRNTMKTYRYYHLQIPVNNERYDRKKALGFADDIRDLLIDSVRLRLRSDVNIGSCLSGGLDSSSIVAIINLLLAKKGVEREHIGKRQKTFTASYRRESDIDESFYARLMIKHTKADGHFIYPDSRALWNELTKLKFHQDEPFGSTSMFAQYKVTQLASGYVKVLLDGQGGDEIFAGYPGYDAVYLADRLRSMDLKGMIHFMLSRIKEHRDGKVFSAFFKGASYMLIPDHAKKYLLKQNVAGILKQIPQSKRFQERFKIVKNKFIFRLNQRLGYDETLYSLPQLLHYEDRNGMAHSLEARVPFIDHRLVELALRIPAVYKMYGGWRKYILRMAMRDLLPEPILWRKDKKGFITPEKKWLFGPGSPVLDMVKTRKIKQYSGYWIWRLFMVNTFTQSYG